MTKLFGTDGIRSRAGDFPLNPPSILAIGQAIGERLGGPILIGQDPRTSSPWIAALLKQGLDRTGIEIEDAGMLPTPAVAILTKRIPVRGGIMISASHNSYEDNGIKVFGTDGRKLADSDETDIETRVGELLDLGQDLAATKHPDFGPYDSESYRISPFGDQYMALLADRFPSGRWLEGLRIIADCANGAMSTLAPALFASLGAEVSTIHASPSGENINAGCGALHPESLINNVRKDRADLGVAFDGDGDRSIFVSSRGELVDGDGILLVMARRFKKAGRLKPPAVVGTSMTNYGLELALAEEGIKLTRVDVGDRHVFEEMLSGGAQLGGEPSGHIIFSDYGLSGDGLLTALKVSEAIVREKLSLGALARGWKSAPQLIKNIRISKKLPLESLPTVGEKISEIAARLEGRGRIVVRYSGTEPLLRIMIESDSADTNDAYADELIGVVEKSLPNL
jgi:phosphoglucosamine mutase